MKIQLIGSLTLVLVSVTGAACQEVRHVGEPAGEHDAYGAPLFGAPWHQHGRGADCVIEWSQFRYGSLWENYCAEKHSRIGFPPCHGDRGFGNDCQPGAVTVRHAAIRGRVTDSRCSPGERERLLSFDLFCELLGWRECRCCPKSCCDRPDCTHCPPTQPDVPVEAVPVMQDPAPAPADPLLDEPADVENEKKTPKPTRPVAPQKSASPAPVLPGVNVPGLDGPTPHGPTPHGPTPHGLQGPAPEVQPRVPRNELPQATPEPLGASRRTGVKVLVTERLSDYIKI